ncbi:MAG: hypothetical protein LBR25_09770 [Erysipelotrichaceae bacterium]|jgi:FSR family fosmidomycin resistance protein-like MFS transporter|nr:hypothetical protein [Erysipelotrichaceae bacterium]
MSEKTPSLIVYTFAHFAVDFSCLWLLYQFVSRPLSAADIGALFLFYNTLAFGLQAPIGDFADRYPKIHFALIGMGLLILGLVLNVFVWPAMILVSLGNACFHVGGGIDSLEHGGGKFTRPGIFVSGGAMGVSLGTLAGKLNLPLYILIPGLLLVTSLIWAFCPIKKDEDFEPVLYHCNHPNKSFSFIFALCMVCIMIRAFGGFVIKIDWASTWSLALLPSIGATLGKALGGFVADKAGAKLTAGVSLTLAALLWGFGSSEPFLFFLGALCFNMCMPITLGISAALFEKRFGFAFGVTVFALLVGSLPAFFISIPYGAVVAAVLSLCSAVCLVLILADPKKEEVNENTAV